MNLPLRVLTMFLAIAWLPAASCNVEPTGPTPAVIGGSTGYGGAAATGGAATGGATTGGATTGGITGNATPERAACENLGRLGCPEGTNIEKCTTDMAMRCANRKVTCATDCLVSASSKAIVTESCHLACGSL